MSNEHDETVTEEISLEEIKQKATEDANAIAELKETADSTLESIEESQSKGNRVE